MCLFVNLYTVLVRIAPLGNIPMLYINYLTMYKVHMHAGAIRKLLYGFAYVGEIIHSLYCLHAYCVKS